MRIFPLAAGLAIGAAVTLTQSCGMQLAKEDEKHDGANTVSDGKSPTTTHPPVTVVVAKPVTTAAVAPLTTSTVAPETAPVTTETPLTSGPSGIPPPEVLAITGGSPELPPAKDCAEARGLLSTNSLRIDGARYIRTPGEQVFAKAEAACQASFGMHVATAEQAARVAPLYKAGTTRCLEIFWAQGASASESVPVVVNGEMVSLAIPSPDKPLGSICTDATGDESHATESLHDLCIGAHKNRVSLAQSLADEKGACSVDSDCVALPLDKTICSSPPVPVSVSVLTAQSRADLATLDRAVVDLCRDDAVEPCADGHYIDKPVCDQGTKTCKLTP